MRSRLVYAVYVYDCPEEEGYEGEAGGEEGSRSCAVKRLVGYF